MSTGYRVTVRQGWSGKEEVLNSERLETLRLNSAQITKDVTAYDQFTFSLSPTHPQFASFKPYTTFVRVTRPDKSTQLFSGRVIKISDGMDSSGVISKTITCEGLEGFLHDSVQPFKEFHDTTPLQFLQALINNHNAQVEDYKKIRLGTVSVTNSTDNVYRFLEDDKDTYANIQDKLISSLGGEIRVRENGGLVLDYQPTISGVANQDVVLARNMLSLQRDVDPTSIITVLKPLGATQTPENASGDSSGKSYPRLTISPVNSGSEYLRDDYLIDQFGVQEKSNVWDDVTTPAALLSKGKALMQAQRNIITQIQVSYVDLSHITPNKFAEFKCGDLVNVISPLQGIDMQERITGMSIDLLNINSSTMTIGAQSMSGMSYEKMQQKQHQAEIEALNKSKDTSQQAKAQAKRAYDSRLVGTLVNNVMSISAQDDSDKETMPVFTLQVAEDNPDFGLNKGDKFGVQVPVNGVLGLDEELKKNKVTYQPATETADGLMSADDKKKIDGLQQYAEATEEQAGLMPAEDKAKLNKLKEEPVEGIQIKDTVTGSIYLLTVNNGEVKLEGSQTDGSER